MTQANMIIIIRLVCVASILLLIASPLSSAFLLGTRSSSPKRSTSPDRVLPGPKAGGAPFGLTLIPCRAQSDGSEEHDYLRSPGDVISPTDDVAKINSLIGERRQCRLRRDFDTADAIQAALERDHGVALWDKEKIWTTSAGKPGRRGGWQDRPQRMAGEERDFGPTGHDYQQTGGPIDPQHCSLTEDEINALLADRLRAKMSRNFDHADMVKAQLDSAGVSVNDKAKAWRADGEAFTFPRQGGEVVGKEKIWTTSAERPGRRGGGQDRPQRMAGEERDFGPTGHDYQQTGGPIDPQHCSLTEDEINALLADRLRAKMNRNFDHADMVKAQLDSAGVSVNDKAKAWRADGEAFSFPRQGGEVVGKEKIWTTSAERPGRRGGGQDRPQRMAGEERDFGPTGHDYQQTGGPIDPQHCSLTEDEINALLADRLRAKMSRNFDHADMVKAQLDSAGVSVNDKARAWRADGEAFTFPRPRGFALVGGGGGLSAEGRAEVEGLLLEREAARRERRYDQADAIFDRLLKEFNVVVADKRGQWWVKGDAGWAFTQAAGSPPLPDDEALRAAVLERVARRSEAKAERDYAAADALQDELREEYGVVFDDRGREWRYVGAPEQQAMVGMLDN